MKAYELYFMNKEQLKPLRKQIAIQAEIAEDIDFQAQREYNALSDEEYQKNAAEYDKHVKETQDKASLLKFHLECLDKAIELTAALEEELEFLEEIGLI